jgi:hypothetical protein
MHVKQNQISGYNYRNNNMVSTGHTPKFIYYIYIDICYIQFLDESIFVSKQNNNEFISGEGCSAKMETDQPDGTFAPAFQSC